MGQSKSQILEWAGCTTLLLNFSIFRSLFFFIFLGEENKKHVINLLGLKRQHLTVKQPDRNQEEARSKTNGTEEYCSEMSLIGVEVVSDCSGGVRLKWQHQPRIKWYGGVTAAWSVLWAWQLRGSAAEVWGWAFGCWWFSATVGSEVLIDLIWWWWDFLLVGFQRNLC